MDQAHEAEYANDNVASRERELRDTLMGLKPLRNTFHQVCLLPGYRLAFGLEEFLERRVYANVRLGKPDTTCVSYFQLINPQL